MKLSSKPLLLGVGLVAGATTFVSGESRVERNREAIANRSLIDSDPDVVYVREFGEERAAEVNVINPTRVWSSKTGGAQLGVIKSGKVELIGFDERACKVKGQGKIGWVRIGDLGVEKMNLQELLASAYERQLNVRKLIAEGRVALGMTRPEVCEILGEPTSETISQNAQGITETLEFTVVEEEDHFIFQTDPRSRITFRRYSHTTQNVIEQQTVKLTDGAVSEFTQEKNGEPTESRVIIRPFAFFW